MPQLLRGLSELCVLLSDCCNAFKSPDLKTSTYRFLFAGYWFVSSEHHCRKGRLLEKVLFSSFCFEIERRPNSGIKPVVRVRSLRLV